MTMRRAFVAIFAVWVGALASVAETWTDERVSIVDLPTGFVPAPKDLGDGCWLYVFDKPTANMVVTARKNLVINRALVVGGGGSGGICWGGGGGGGGFDGTFMPDDWNNGTGGRFYDPTLNHGEIVRRLLM